VGFNGQQAWWQITNFIQTIGFVTHSDATTVFSVWLELGTAQPDSIKVGIIIGKKNHHHHNRV
jgi:hypothetical protein